jgi:hypothetical protein
MNQLKPLGIYINYAHSALTSMSLQLPSVLEIEY